MNSCKVQAALSLPGYALVIDGVTGPKARSTIIAFQRKAGFYPGRPSRSEDTQGTRSSASARGCRACARPPVHLRDRVGSAPRARGSPADGLSR